MGEQRQHPRNVRAVIDWYKKHKGPVDVAAIEKLFNPPPGPASSIQLACEALVLQGFEAGREYQHANPSLEPDGCYADGPGPRADEKASMTGAQASALVNEYRFCENPRRMAEILDTLRENGWKRLAALCETEQER